MAGPSAEWNLVMKILPWKHTGPGILSMEHTGPTQMVPSVSSALPSLNGYQTSSLWQNERGHEHFGNHEHSVSENGKASKMVTITNCRQLYTSNWLYHNQQTISSAALLRAPSHLLVIACNCALPDALCTACFPYSTFHFQAMILK